MTPFPPVCVLALALVHALAAAPAPAPTPAPDPLDQLNAAFTEAYRQARTSAQARPGPVLLLAGDHLLLLRDGVRTAAAEVRPPLYHRLKSLDHVPLALLLLGSAPDRPVPPERLRDLRGQVQGARDGLARWCPPDLRGRQARILDACAALLEAWAARGNPEPGRLGRFAADLGPLLLANAGDAAAAQLEALDRAAARFRADLGGTGWRSVRVVLLGSHMARSQDLALQYFCRLLGEPGEGGRIVYAEGLDQPAQGLELLATHRVDGFLGAACFGDPARLHRDVLADGARRWLDTHVPVSDRSD
jgi:hypothetical protein